MRRQVDQLHTPAGEEGVNVDEKGVGPLAHKSCESHIDLAAGACVEDLDFQPDGASSRLRIFQRGLGIGAGRVDEHGNASGCGHQLMHEFQALRHQLSTEKIDSCQVAARPGEAGDKTNLHRVFGQDEHYGGRRACRLGRQCAICQCGDHGDLAANQISRQLWQPIDLILGEAIDDCHVLTLNVARLFEPLAKSEQTVRERVRRCRVEEPDHRHRRLLSVRRDWPRRRCAADRLDEITPSHAAPRASDAK